MKKTIAVLPGDGVGPEVIAEAVKVLKKVAQKYKHQFDFKKDLIGYCLASFSKILKVPSVE